MRLLLPRATLPVAALHQRSSSAGLPREVEERATGIVMVLVPGGEFLRGLRAAEVPADADEFEDFGVPAHEVVLTRPFYLGKYEVTQGEWERVMGYNPSQFAFGSRYPVESVTWMEAVQFCGRTGFRLPTEAEWERACRFGSASVEVCGRSVAEEAWYATGTHGDREGTRPVGLKQPNPLGLYDMAGNVFEYSQDWWLRYPSPAQRLVDPKGPQSGRWKVVRGGSWASGDRWCNCVFRLQYAPTRRVNTVGLRVARDP